MSIADPSIELAKLRIEIFCDIHRYNRAVTLFGIANDIVSTIKEGGAGDVEVSVIIDRATIRRGANNLAAAFKDIIAVFHVGEDAFHRDVPIVAKANVGQVGDVIDCDIVLPVRQQFEIG